MKRSMKLAAAMLLSTAAFCISGCGTPMRGDPRSTAREREQLYKYEGSDVTLVGHTRMVDSERYRGAAVVLDDGTEVRVPEVKSWPRFNTGDEITIRGRLRRYTPTGTPGAHPNEWFALEAVRWQKGDLVKK